MTDAAVVVSGLVKRYRRTAAVDGLSLTARRGAVTALLGPNGAGKTTTVECIEGLRHPDAGSVQVLGSDPHRRSSRVGVKVGVMLQEGGGGYPAAKAGEMLSHVAGLYAHPHDVGVLAERLGISGVLGTPVRRLSGGERQRLSFAMAIVGRPEVVLLDEPTAGLDPHARLAAWDLVRDLRAAGVAVLLTSHHMEEVERLADQVVIIDHGREIAVGAPAELIGSSENEVTFAGPTYLPVDELNLALREGVLATETAPGRYAVRGSIDAEVLATVTAWCAAQSVMPQGLTVGRRTLEDVFIGLTGRGLRS